MEEKISFAQMENEVRSKLEGYEHLAASAYDEAMNRSRIKHKLNEEEKLRAKNKARIARILGVAVSVLIAVFFYKSFFGW